MPRKTCFLLNPQSKKDKGSEINIIGDVSKGQKVHLSICGADKINIGYIEHRDLERFAVNILKALGSKKLALSQRHNAKIFFKKQKKLKPTTQWTRIIDHLPPENQEVETKIDDYMGVRNEQTLKRVGKLWMCPDGSMYVYYTPTHWREKKDTIKQ